MKARILSLLLLAILLGGCGPTAGGTSDPSDLLPVSATPFEVRGRVQADVPLEGAEVQLFDLEGQPLMPAPQASGVNGDFTLFAAFPRSFRVVAIFGVPGRETAAAVASGTLAGEFRNFQGKYIGINFVTNLVSLYMEENPEVSLEDAEARVRRYLAIPEGVDLGTGLDADKGYFSRTVFAQRASANGGVEAYTRSLVPKVDSDPPSPIVAAEAQDTSPLGGLAKDVAGSLVKSAGTAAASEGFGWVTSLAGFNFGGPSMKQISDQLNAIQDQLNAIQAEIALQTLTLQYSQDQAALEPVVSNISNTTNQVSSLANQFSNLPVQGPPVSSAPDQPLITQLQSQNPPWDSLANEILDYLLGRNSLTNMVILYNGIVMGTVGADSSASQYGGYPLRSNALLQQIQNQANFYLQTVDQALNLLAETNHLVTRDISGNFTSNAVPIMLAKASMLSILASARTAWEQVPAPLQSDIVLIDMEFGLIWYLPVLPPDTYNDALFDRFRTTGPYGGSSAPFTLPNKAQLDSLRYRLHAINSGNPTAAMPTLGFQNVPKVSDLEVWYVKDSSASPEDYAAGCNGTYYLMNSGDTKDDNICSHPGKTHAYLLVLPFPGPAEKVPSNPLLTTGVPGTMTIQATSSSQLQCLASNSPITSGGTFTVGGKGYSHPIVTVYRTSDDLTGDVTWTSSNNNVADISNLDGEQGQITWHPNVPGGLVPVTFTAKFGAQSASLTVNPPNPAPTATLTSIQVLPTNLLYGLPARNEYYHATGFYDDDTALNLDSQVTWSVVATADGSPIPPAQAGFTTSQPNLLVISPTLATSQLTVRATLGGVTGTAPIEVPIPNP